MMEKEEEVWGEAQLRDGDRIGKAGNSETPPQMAFLHDKQSHSLPNRQHDVRITASAKLDQIKHKTVLKKRSKENQQQEALSSHDTPQIPGKARLQCVCVFVCTQAACTL
jgi:hypothetical protein